MYCPHLVPLPYPLLGLCLKVVPLLLLVALRVRYLASGMWWIRWKPFKNIGFKANNGNLYPGQIPRRFFKSGCEMLQTSSMSLCEDPTQRGGGLHDFSWVILLLRNFGSPQTKRVQRKKKGKKTRRSSLGMDMQNMCAKFQGLSRRKGWTFRLLCGKHGYFA